LFIRLTGGEPLIHPHFKKLVKYILSKNMGVGLNTNAIFLDKKNISFIKKNISAIRISLDGLENILLKIRGEINFSKLLNNIYLIKKNNIPLSINCCVMKSNINEIDKFLNFCINSKFNNISFNLIKPCSDHRNNSELIDLFTDNYLIKNRVIKNFKKIYKLNKHLINIELDNFLYFLIYKKYKSNSFCGADTESAYININGAISGCRSLPSKSNIFKLDDYSIINLDTVNKFCSHCNYKSICKKSCPAYVINYILNSDYYDKFKCPYIRIN
jgi:radical SAM protein with 4Fe4S-binding SPASM domain